MAKRSTRSLKEQLEELKHEIQATARFGITDPSPYISHASLLTRARRSRPKAPAPTVTSFADWVFSLYHHTHDAKAMKLGKEGEVMAELIRSEKKRRARRPADSGWDLEYADKGEATEPYVISCLRLNGEPLRARPDRVLRQQSTNARRIVEIKTTRTRRPIPPFGWPNLKVQLWCYGLIDNWRDAPKVLLTGEILNLTDRRYYPTSTWDSKDPRVHSECEELFNLFGGKYVGN
jgi:hypothetical protein